MINYVSEKQREIREIIIWLVAPKILFQVPFKTKANVCVFFPYSLLHNVLSYFSL